MSQYIDFYIKPKSNKVGDWISIGDFSRSSNEYTYGECYCQYEKGCPVTTEKINYIISDINDAIENLNEHIKQQKERIPILASFNNSMEEKLEAMGEHLNYISESEEELKSLQKTKEWYEYLQIIIDSNKYEDSIDEEDLIYFGIEWNPNYKEE